MQFRMINMPYDFQGLFTFKNKRAMNSETWQKMTYILMEHFAAVKEIFKIHINFYIILY